MVTDSLIYAGRGDSLASHYCSSANEVAAFTHKNPVNESQSKEPYSPTNFRQQKVLFLSLSCVGWLLANGE